MDTVMAAVVVVVGRKRYLVGNRVSVVAAVAVAGSQVAAVVAAGH